MKGRAKGRVCGCIQSMRLGSCERESVWVNTEHEVGVLLKGKYVGARRELEIGDLRKGEYVGAYRA